MNEINELGDIEEVQTFVPGIPERAKTSLQVKASESLEFGAGVTVLPTQGIDVKTAGPYVPDKYGFQINEIYRMPTSTSRGDGYVPDATYECYHCLYKFVYKSIGAH